MTQKELHHLKDISITVHLFKERDVYVAYVPELDVSSCGDTAEEARKNIEDAVRGFIQTSAEMGTLEDILEESGFRLEDEKWRPPEFVSVDQFTLSLD